MTSVRARFSVTTPVFGVLLAVALLSGAAMLTRYVAAEEAAPVSTQAPAQVVRVSVIEPRVVQIWSNFSGRLVPVNAAAIKPLVSGTITEVLFEDGQRVEKGMSLFTIDPRPHQNALTRAEAGLASARAKLELAQDDYRRFEKLNARNLYADSGLDQARASLRMAEAAEKEAQSSVQQAVLNLEYARVIAPISGRVGRAELTAGNVVEAGPNAPVLTTIVAADPLYAEFDVDEKSYLRLSRQAAGDKSLPVEVTPAENASTTYSGHLHAFDNHLDAGSGTIRARALIENSDGILTPGLFVSVRLGSSQPDPVLLVPVKALGTNQDRRFVYVVDENNTVVYREVTLGESWQNQRVVLSGLSEGERVITEGLSLVGPGMPVSPEPDESAAMSVR